MSESGDDAFRNFQFRQRTKMASFNNGHSYATVWRFIAEFSYLLPEECCGGGLEKNN
jgi:hypothetical protein